MGNGRAERRIGRYVVLEELGRGGMGVVYRARDPAIAREVALKVVLGAGAAGPEALARFVREARATARLSHPGIVPVHDVGEQDQKPFLVMELVGGRPLSALLAEEALPPRRLARLLAGVARAVEHAHAHGVIHRDLKPANIMLDADDRVRVLDFGLARDETATQQLTRTGQVLGTPAYMAPEQADDGEVPQTASVDVYALGATLYHGLTGRPPFTGSNALEIIKQVLIDAPMKPRELDPTVSPTLEALALRCLAKEPGDRPASAGELADALERFAAGESEPARPDAAGARGRRPMTIGMMLAVAAGLTVAAIVVTRGERLDAPSPTRASIDPSHTRPPGPLAGPRSAPPTAAPPQPQPDAVPVGREPRWALHDEAVALYRARRFEEAVATFSKVIALDPSTHQAWFGRGGALIELQQIGPALSDFGRAIELAPDQAFYWFERGKLRLVLGLPVEALGDLDEALRLDPKAPAAYWTAHGRALVLARDAAEALPDFARALSLDPAAHEARLWRGKCYNWLGQPVEAIGDLSLYIAARPDDREGWHFRASARRSLDPAGAAADYEKAIALIEAAGDHGSPLLGELRPQRALARDAAAADREQPTPTIERAEARARRDPSGALRDVERLIAREPDRHAAWLLRGRLRQQTDPAGAIADYDMAITLAPERAAYWSARAEALARSSRPAQALADMEQAIRLAPDDLDARFGRAELRFATKDVDGAAADVEHVLGRDARNARALDLRARIREERGDIDGALADLERAAELQPLLRQRLASTLEKHERLAEAERAYERVATDYPRLHDARLGRARVRLALGRTEEAKSELDALIPEIPDAPIHRRRRSIAYELRGDAAARLGDSGAAADDYREAIELAGRDPTRRATIAEKLTALGAR